MFGSVKALSFFKMFTIEVPEQFTESITFSNNSQHLILRDVSFSRNSTMSFGNAGLFKMLKIEFLDGKKLHPGDLKSLLRKNIVMSYL